MNNMNSSIKNEKLSSTAVANTEILTKENFQILQVNTCTGNETVLLIQDQSPWGTNADVIELQAQGVNFCTISSDQIGAVDLSRFKEIIIPSQQPLSYYQNIMPGGNIASSIEAFVRNGGVLSANLAPYSMDDWRGYSFVGGLQHIFVTDSGSILIDNNNIVASSHPIITAALPCFGGNCGKIVDEGFQNDLDGWNWSSHGYFTNLPAGKVVILADENNNPVMIEYPYGTGRVIATLTTSEHRYGFYNEKKLLANELAYQSYLVRQLSRGLIIEVD